MKTQESPHTEIRFVGLRRSGTHAAQNWLISLFPSPICYINDVNRKRNLHLGTKSDLLPSLQRRRTAKLGDNARLLLYSYEDARLIHLRRNQFPFSSEKDDSIRQHTILILRDPYNLFASRLQIMRDRSQNPLFRDMLMSNRSGQPFLPILWKNYAKEFLGETAHLGNRTIFLNYNHWVVNSRYRQNICDQLGVPLSEKHLRDVPSFGFGSSFDQRSFHREADKMNIFTRWKKFDQDEEFQTLIDDPELHDLSLKIFGAAGPSTPF